MQSLPGLTKIVRKIHVLADTPLQSADFLAACESVSWPLHPETYEGERREFMQFKVRLSAVNELFLSVNLADDFITCALLPFFFWEDYDVEDYESEALYLKARRAFDRRFEQALAQAVKVLGPPQRRWIEGETQFQKAVWRIGNCLLALQQDDSDTQFGFDLNFLLQPCPEPLRERPNLVI
jgi:hypothetical protein